MAGVDSIDIYRLKAFSIAIFFSMANLLVPIIIKLFDSRLDIEFTFTVHLCVEITLDYIDILRL
jgi:hypothetical protein